MGKMGAGKTLAQSALATFLHQTTGLPLFANYELQDAQMITDMGQVWDMEQAIFCFDEIWLSADSRLWQDNVALTRWVNQTRKKKLLIFYTTQHISQVEMRIRKATDVLIYAQKLHGEHWLNFIDYQYGQLGRRLLLNNPKRFYSLYNTFEVVHPVSMRGIPSEGASTPQKGGKNKGSGKCLECGKPLDESWKTLCSLHFRESKRRSDIDL